MLLHKINYLFISDALKSNQQIFDIVTISQDTVLNKIQQSVLSETIIDRDNLKNSSDKIFVDSRFLFYLLVTFSESIKDFLIANFYKVDLYKTSTVNIDLSIKIDNKLFLQKIVLRNI